jgi:hypothetical protein
VDAPRTDLLAGFISEDELAAALGTCTRTIRRWRALRTGPPHIEVGREIRYGTEAVREWLAAGGTAAKRPRARRDPK